MPNSSNAENVEYLAQCALMSANGDFAVAIANIRLAVTSLAKQKLKQIIDSDEKQRAESEVGLDSADQRQFLMK